MREIIAAGLAESAHDLSDGGLAVALAESCTSAIGAKITPSGSEPEFERFRRMLLPNSGHDIATPKMFPRNRHAS